MSSLGEILDLYVPHFPWLVNLRRVRLLKWYQGRRVVPSTQSPMKYIFSRRGKSPNTITGAASSNMSPRTRVQLFLPTKPTSGNLHRTSETAKRVHRLQIPKGPHGSIIQLRSGLTRQPREETLLRTLSIQIGQKIIIDAFPIRLGEASLRFEIGVAEIVAHAAMQEIEAGGIVG